MATDLAVLQIQVETKGVAEAKAGLDSLKATGVQVESQAKQTTTATSAAAEMMQRYGQASTVAAGGATTAAAGMRQVAEASAKAETATQAAARSLANFGQASTISTGGATTASGAMAALAQSARTASTAAESSGAAANVMADRLGKTGQVGKLASHEMANLGRQFADVGVQASMGTNALMILIMQGPQIADVFATAAARGVTLKAALLDVAVAARAALASYGLLAGALGIVVAGFALFSRGAEEAARRTAMMEEATRQFSGAMKEAQRYLRDAAQDAAKFGQNSNGAVAGTQALTGATSELALKTWELANARAEAARQSLNEAYTANQKRLSEMRNPGILGGVGRALYEDQRYAAGRAARQRRLADEKALEDENAQLLSQMVGITFSKQANQADGYSRALGGVSDKTGAVTRATEEAAEAMKKLRDETASVLEGLMTPLERETKRIRDQQLTLRAALDKGVIDLQEFRDAIDRMFPERLSEKDLIKVPDVGELKKPWEEAGEALRQGIEDHKNAWNDALGGMGQSFRNFVEGWVVDGKASWRGLLSDMMNLLESWARSAGGKFNGVFQKIGGALGASAGRVSTGVGAAIGQGLGLGTGNGTADMAISVAGGALGGMFASTTMATSFASAVGTALTPALGTAMATSLTGFLGSAAFLGPIAIIAALGAATLLGNKQPSNFGALATLSDTSFTLSGNKRTSETEGMATAAANAVLQGQQMLRDAGIQLGVTVRSLDLGTRDLTDIILSNGTALTSAVGDAAAAAETALKAVLQGATYTSEAQKALVDSMLAAGSGFDAVAEALGVFNARMAAAAGLQQSIADQILKLRDPQGYDVTILQRTQEARLKELQDYLTGGFLTQAEFDKLSGMLGELNGLEMADVLKRYADEQKSLATAASAATDVVSDAVKSWRDIADRLAAYSKGLTAGSDVLSPLSAYRSAKNAFDALKPGDVDSFEKLMGGVGNAYIDAAKAIAPDQRTLALAIGRVREFAREGEVFARTQAGDVYRPIVDATAAVRGEVAALRSENKELQAQVATLLTRVAAAVETTKTVLVRVTRDGESMVTEAA